MKFLRNEKGMALVTVVLAMAVTAVMGTAVLAFSLSDTRFAQYQERHLQAEYIARAGADAAAKYVQDHPSAYPLGGFADQTVTGTLGEGSYSAVISRPYQGAVLVTCVGMVGEASETVTLSLSKGSYSSLFRGIRQTAPDTDLDLDQLEITYDSGAAVDIEGHVRDAETDISLSNHNPDNESDPNISKGANYDSAGEVIVPDYSGFSGSVDSTGGVTTITGNLYLSSLTKSNHETIVFDTQGGSQTVVVYDLSFGGSHGTVDIIGGGVVHLYILHYGAIDNPVNVNGGSPSQLFVYVADGGTIELQANCTLSAYISAPNATIEIQSDHTTVTGAMIGNIVRRNGTQGPLGKFHYVPLPSGTDYSGLLSYVRSYYSN